MFDDISFEILIERMLDRVVEQNSNIDIREGSIIYNAVAPAAYELMEVYIEMKRIYDESFADTASREALVKRCAERGITPKEETPSILEGTFNVDVPIGARFSLDDLNYTVIEKISDFLFKLECETPGIVGNSRFGTLIPIDYIEGLETAKLTRLLIPGEDEEDTEVLRERYFSSFDSQAFGGNKKDYVEKTNAIDGVGATKVTPLWDGGGTVLLTIINSNFEKATDELIQTVKNIIDPLPGGIGTGLAPIGHIVTVESAEEMNISISLRITFEDGYDFERVKESIENILNDYFLSLRMNWANTNETIVRITQIETRILSINGIVDISGTKINGLEQNLVIPSHMIPVLEGVYNE